MLSLKDYIQDENGKKLFKILKNGFVVEENDNFRYVYLEVESGTYGFDSNIVDTRTKEISYVRKKEEAEVFNFRMFFAVPKGDNVYKAIMLFQNIGQYGIKSIISKYIHKFFSEELNLYTTTGNVCPEMVVKKLLENNKINKLIYTKNNISNDDSDIEKIGYGKEERVLTKIYNTNMVRNLISSYLNGNNRVYEFENVDYDDLKVVCDVFGKERKFSVNNIDKLSIIEGIPNEILNENNDIDDCKLKQHFINISEEYLEHMVYKE